MRETPVTSGLLATKFHRPSAPPKQVHRPRLIRRLNDGLEAGRWLTLVSAPAGFGKTTCIGEWAHTLDWPVAWLPLGHEIESVLLAGEVPPAEIISAGLINDILELEGRFLLVLDDV